jgi:hypothetical protein
MTAAKRLEIKDAVMLVFSVHGWGNRKKVDQKKVKIADDAAKKNMFNTTKMLVDPKGELEKIKNYQNTVVKGWVTGRSVPSFFAEGSFLFRIDQVSVVEEYLKKSSKELAALVEDFVSVYSTKIDEAETLLGPKHFNRKDYPTAQEMRDRFWFEWRWVEFNVPKSLPDEVFKAEKKKAEAQWSNAAEMITQSLRVGFKELIDYAVGVLKVGKDGKMIGWKNSTFDNIREFIELFQIRNITNDEELAALVKSAEKVLSGLNNPQDIKKDGTMRKYVDKQFKEINKTLDTLIEVKPKRRFSFDD